jgi:hypothetical protein
MQLQPLHSKTVAPRRFLWCQEEKLASPFTFGLCRAEPHTLSAPYLAALPWDAAPVAGTSAVPRLLA